MRSKHVVGTLDQQATEIDVASLGDPELRISVARLAASWPQAQVAANIATSLEPFLAPQRQDIRQCRELANAVDFDQRLRLRVRRLRQLLDQTVIVLDLLPSWWRSVRALGRVRVPDLAAARPCTAWQSTRWKRPEAGSRMVLPVRELSLPPPSADERSGCGHETEADVLTY